MITAALCLFSFRTNPHIVIEALSAMRLRCSDRLGGDCWFLLVSHSEPAAQARTRAAKWTLTPPIGLSARIPSPPLRHDTTVYGCSRLAVTFTVKWTVWTVRSSLLVALRIYTHCRTAALFSYLSGLGLLILHNHLLTVDQVYFKGHCGLLSIC